MFTVTAPGTAGVLQGGIESVEVKFLEFAGGALQFDGIEDLCTVLDTNEDFEAGSALTVEAWVRSDNPIGNQQFISADEAYGLFGQSNGNLRMTVLGDGLGLAAIASSVLPTGDWTHIASTWDGSTVSLYVNGEFESSNTFALTPNPVSRLLFGAEWSANQHGECAMDEVRIWNTVRTPGEIAANYCVSLCGDHPGLVGNYKFDEAGGQVIRDSSSRGNDGVLGDTNIFESSDPTRIASGVLVVKEEAKGALEFDGVDDICTVLDTNDDLDLGSALTLEAWVRLDTPGIAQGFVSGGSAGTTAYSLFATSGNPGMFVTAFQEESAFQPTPLPGGVWTHLAGTFDGEFLRFYVNGVLVASAHELGSTFNVTSLVLGRFSAGSNTLHGAMDEVRVWNLVRSDTEILENHNLALDGNEPGLVGYYKFDEVSGQTLVDSSPFNNHGSLGADSFVGSDDPTRIASGVSFCIESTVYHDLCNGDGGDQMGCTDCPCGNNAPAGLIGGCMHSASVSLYGGAGSRLVAEGDASVSLPPNSTTDLKLSMMNMPPISTAVMFSGGGLAPQDIANPCFGMGVAVNLMSSGAKDGLRCATGGLLRHGNRQSDSNGNIADDLGPSRTWGGAAGPIDGLAFQSGFTAGQTRYFQATHRDLDTAQCMTGLNTSQAVEVTFTP